ncbi:molybdate ABC transporter permease subunit [Corynebacterium mendelii]|uniref:ABC transporter permease subunit n=1 Tax=Corynebacterium mendelii TaxID=2765362 RepID=A0A939DYZ5_9CORY|nr:ABC transporter permease subunit [Corynebacterium mendelii]MBN9643839.1 ABC transporter permease subunit [Corynebacterium mendelii]
MRIPWPVTAAAGVCLLFVVLPLVSLFTRVNWAEFSSVVSSSAALSALLLSFATALSATLLCVLLGVPLAMVIAAAGPKLAAGLRCVVMVPLLMPPLVGGLALLAFLGRHGLAGRALGFVGITVPFTTPAVVIAQTFVALPFLVILVEQAIRSIDPRLAGVARTLGAGDATVWSRVTLPLVAPAITAGATLSFSRALAEFGATAMFAGNVESTTRTMPLAIYTAFSGGMLDVEQAYALSVILVAAAVGVLVALRGWRVGGV